MSRMKRTLSYLKGFSEEQEALLNLLEVIAGEDERKRIEKRLHAQEVSIKRHTLQIGEHSITYPQITKEPELNTQLREAAQQDSYESFSEDAYDEITSMIAPNILGMESVKRAAALQLFCTERMHLLLLGDPGTGKTEILSSSNDLAPISSMGLGSGTSGAGLSVAYTKGELQKGLLMLAHNGICCIDELNLMKKDDRAALYNAMEKGFITYDKGGKHEKFDANVKVLATANPKGDQFEGEDLKEQLPFEAALLSRFHMVFVIRKPDKKQFLDITRKIVRNQKHTKKDSQYVTDYITHAQTLEVKFPSHLEVLVSEAAETIKEAEENLLIEVSPRIVNGIIGFAQASARMHLRTTVTAEDVRNVLELLGESLSLEL